MRMNNYGASVNAPVRFSAFWPFLRRSSVNMKWKLLIWLTFIVCFPSPTVASDHIRVALADGRKTVTVGSSSGLVLDGRKPGSGSLELTFTPADLDRNPLRIRAVDGIVRLNGKRYRGWMELRKKKNGLLLVINDLDIEDYLRGVITSEIPSDWEEEALKAQAVASRTYALYQKGTAGNRPYHIRATVDSQVYNGISGERPQGIKAVRATTGLVVAYQGEIIPAFYHASCGGHTENAAELWGIDEPYLKGVDCNCQEIVTNGLWEKRIKISQIAGALRRIKYGLVDIRDMGIGEITPAGRVKDVIIRGPSRTRTVPAEVLRAAIGNSMIPSVFFDVELSGDEAVFSGRGSGHGVGLCQWGAREMARNGSDFRSILSHYYPGTTLEQTH